MLAFDFGDLARIRNVEGGIAAMAVLLTAETLSATRLGLTLGRRLAPRPVEHVGDPATPFRAKHRWLQEADVVLGGNSAVALGLSPRHRSRPYPASPSATLASPHSFSTRDTSRPSIECSIPTAPIPSSSSAHAGPAGRRPSPPVHAEGAAETRAVVRSSRRLLRAGRQACRPTQSDPSGECAVGRVRIPRRRLDSLRSTAE